MERKPLNKAELFWILLASVVVLGGIAYYLIFLGGSTSSIFHPNASSSSDSAGTVPIKVFADMTPAEKATLLDSLKPGASSGNNNTISSPGGIDGTSTRQTSQPQVTEQQMLDSLKPRDPSAKPSDSLLASLKPTK